MEYQDAQNRLMENLATRKRLGQNHARASGSAIPELGDKVQGGAKPCDGVEFTSE